MSIFDKLLDLIGEPLYYCADCKRRVRVNVREGQDAEIVRFCEHKDAAVIAPRKAILVGEGGMQSLPWMTRMKWKARTIASDLTGRNV